MKEKYRVLRIMATVYKVLAWIALVAGVAISILILVAGSLISQQLGTAGAAGGSFVAFLVTLIYALFSFATLYALGEAINLLFDIERQTNTTQEQVRDIRKAA